jgi:signal transduction histidine kinase/ligand-binding sensor domain-containing protein
VRRVLRLVSTCVVTTVGPSAVVAQPLAQWHHTAWTARDGLSGRAQALAQTADGFLWIGTTAGLFRFDGVQFERIDTDEGDAPRVAVSALAAVRGGGLWIGYDQGGATLLDAGGRATHHRGDPGLPFGRVRSLARTDDGAVWLSAVGGLSRFADGRWDRVRHEWGYTCRSASALLVDRAGALWVGGATPDRLFLLPKGSRRFELAVDGLSAARLAQVVDGRLLVGDGARDLIHVLHPRAVGGYGARVVADSSGSTIAADREGGVWVAGFGISRLTPRENESTGGWGDAAPDIDRFSQPDGLSGSVARDVLIDREGNTWVATDAGLDRLRRRNLTWTQPRGNSFQTSLVAGPRLEVWALWWNQRILRAQDGRVVPSAPTAKWWWGYHAPDDTILVGGESGLWRWRDGSFSPIAPPAEVSAKGMRYPVLAATVDLTGRIWASISGVGQFRLDDDTWTFVPVLPGRPDMTALAAHTSEDGRVWLAYPDSLAVVDRTDTRVFAAREIGVGAIRTIGGRAGLVWVGGETGLAVLRNDRFVAVRPADAASRVGSVSSLLATAQHGLWLNASARIVHLPQSEIDRVLSDPGRPVAFDTFDLVSDLPEPLQDHHLGETVLEDRNGTLWFVTQHRVARLDPRRIRRNALAPPVVVRSLTADDRAYQPRGLVRLPAHTRSIRIDYTALSLTIPERVRFRYRLEGWETRWHDAGQRRAASYTDLRPGTYGFRVLACNNDGVWNETGAELAFTVLPAWYQTAWFRAAVVASLVGALVLLYRLRVRRVRAELAARFDERLAERTRLARELHDTLVQTVQGSRLVARHAAAHTDDPAGTRRDLERLSAWLDRAVQEARAALNALRPSGAGGNDLAEAVRRIAVGSDGPDAPAISVSTRGVARALHPVVQDEACAIAHEAMRNACAHARATRLTVEIEYGRDLVMLVTDNGVGMDHAVLDAGRPGHFGLAGMRERAANIQAALSLTSSSAGTSIRLIVPGRLAFREHRPAHDL